MQRAAITAVVAAALLSSAEGYVCCYVRPGSSNTTCPYPNCYTLQQYAAEPQSVTIRCRLGHSNTVYRFLDGGKHLLFDNIALNFTQSESVFLLGNWTEGAHTVSHAEIECRGSGGLLFHYGSNIVISHLTFSECGHLFGGLDLNYQSTLAFHNVINLKLSSVVVRNGTGYGLYALCAMGSVSVENSVFSHNKGRGEHDGGNVGFLYENCSETPSLLSVRFSHFLKGSSRQNHSLATGLSVFVWTSGVNVEIDNITAIGNSGGERAVGGNVLLILRNKSSLLTNWMVVRNSYIAEGSAYTGGGMYISILGTVPYNSPQNISGNGAHRQPPAAVLAREVVTIVNTVFVGNHAGHEGGGLYLITHEDPGIFSPIGRVTIRDCVFFNNSLESDYGGGVALHLNNHYVLAYLNHSDPQFYTALVNCTIERNILVSETDVEDVVFTASSAVFVILKPSGVVLEDCRILNNSCTGVTAVTSAIVFSGEVVVAGNNGTNGGGIILCDGGYMLLRAYTTLYIQDNSARHAGGGIYAEDTCLQSEPPCFFQLDIAIYRDPLTLNETVHVEMTNNTAVYAGSAIFGGSVVYCMLFPQLVPDLNKKGQAMFKQIFNIVHPASDLSPISSEPFKVCFCNHMELTCTNRSIERWVYPGKNLSVYVVTVGQANGIAAHTVSATPTHVGSTLNDSETLQDTKSDCTQLHYTVFSRESSEVVSLQVHQQSGISSEASRRGIARINITFMPCPIGFSVSTGPQYKCDCIPALKGRANKCDIEQMTIERVDPTWIGCYSLTHNHSPNHTSSSSSAGYGIMFQRHCPYDFCKDKSVDITTGPKLSEYGSNAQCAYHRAGILCGDCEKNYSLILGNSECRKCTSKNLWLIPFFAVAGLLLVLLLILTDISVSSGSLSGLIFYANLVQISSPVFFGKYVSYRGVYLCSVFIAWLNLDFGIETCFYDGMGAFGKTWLQFAFPLYVWGIAAVIILLSRRFPSTYIAGRSPVRLLATLFLLSYAKLLRTIIRALSYVWLFELTIDNEKLKSRLLWTEDGSVNYLRGKHIPLFVVAVGFGLVTLPYALVLFSLQWLQKGSHLKVCSWVVRMNPFFDAYTAPYKPHCRFWTGSLLLIRVLIFLVFASPHAHPTMRLSVILATCVMVQTIAWSFHGVFRSKYTNVINSLFFLNLGLFSAITSYSYTNHSTHQAAVIIVSVGTSFVLFVSMLLYHTLHQVRETRVWKHFNVWLRYKKGVSYPCLRRRKGVEREHARDLVRQSVTQTLVDPFDIQYREPLISSDSSSYGSL